MLLTRIISALLGAPLLLFLLYKGGIFLLLACVVLALLALRELFAMAGGLGFRSWPVSGYVSGLILILAAYFEQGRFLPFLFILWLLYCLAHMVLNYPDTSMADLGFNFLAVSYVILLFGHLILLRRLEQGIYLTSLTFGLTWATDTGAYFAGRAFGRHKLAPLVSPNKTVEGAVGGMALAVLAAVLTAVFLPNASLSTPALILLAAAVAVTGQLGDLAESAIKRFAGVKDSGNIIPGHGGVLDRFDSILFTAPTVYYIFQGIIS